MKKDLKKKVDYSKEFYIKEYGKFRYYSSEVFEGIGCLSVSGGLISLIGSGLIYLFNNDLSGDFFKYSLIGLGSGIGSFIVASKLCKKTIRTEQMEYDDYF